MRRRRMIMSRYFVKLSSTRPECSTFLDDSYPTAYTPRLLLRHRGKDGNHGDKMNI